MRWHEKINRWLASSVSELNAVLALVIAAAVALVAGTAIGDALNNWLLGFVFGIAVGAVAAVLVCGALADSDRYSQLVGARRLSTNPRRSYGLI